MLSYITHFEVIINNYILFDGRKYLLYESSKFNFNFKKGNVMANEQPALIINSQYIKDLSLEIPHAPQIFSEIKTQPSLTVNIDVRPMQIADHVYTVDLNLNLNGDTDGKKLFILELTYSAAITLNVPEEHMEEILNIEIPRLIYPYARNVVTQCLMESGLPPIMLNPLDFAAIYAARKAEKNAEKSDKDSEKKN